MRRVFGSEVVPEGSWTPLLSAISNAYHEADQERQLIENALEVNAQELTEANNKLRLLIDNAPAGIVMLDRAMRCIFASRRWLQDRQLTLQDIVGRGHAEILPEMAGRWDELTQRCLAGAEKSGGEDPILQPDGTTDWISGRCFPGTRPMAQWAASL